MLWNLVQQWRPSFEKKKKKRRIKRGVDKYCDRVWCQVYWIGLSSSDFVIISILGPNSLFWDRIGEYKKAARKVAGLRAPAEPNRPLSSQDVRNPSGWIWAVEVPDRPVHLVTWLIPLGGGLTQNQGSRWEGYLVSLAFLAYQKSSIYKKCIDRIDYSTLGEGKTALMAFPHFTRSQCEPKLRQRKAIS